MDFSPHINNGDIREAINSIILNYIILLFIVILFLSLTVYIWRGEYFSTIFQLLNQIFNYGLNSSISLN